MDVNKKPRGDGLTHCVSVICKNTDVNICLIFRGVLLQITPKKGIISNIFTIDGRHAVKRILALLLCLVTVLAMSACGNTNTPVETTAETEPVDTFPYPAIQDKLTWEKINALPTKRTDMTVQEMREACVQFMKFSKTALWIPNESMKFVRNAGGTEDEITKGVVYAGFPYIRLGTGNVYRAMDYINEKGVMDMEHFLTYPEMLGNQCSASTYWAWARVINSVGFEYTNKIIQSSGYLRVGPYTYDDSMISYTEQCNTKHICQQNGMQKMFESYAQLHLADGLVQHSGTAGHVIMVAEEPHVVYNGDQIDPFNSYIIKSDQGQGWTEYTNEQGDKAQVKLNVEKKLSFMELYEDSYLPFTFAEFLGTKGIDETQCTIDLSGDSVEASKLFTAAVKTNFGLSDVYVSLKNADGKEVYRLAVCVTVPGEKELRISRNARNAFSWGDFEKLSGEYLAEVSAQLTTGERPVLYSGKTTIQQ